MVLCTTPNLFSLEVEGRNQDEGHVIYYSAPSRQLQWLSEECYPGIPAKYLNVAALYEDTLKHKLTWFYSQVHSFRIDDRR